MIIPTIMMTTQDNNRTQEQTTATGTSHGCICGITVESIGKKILSLLFLEQACRTTLNMMYINHYIQVTVYFWILT